MYKICSIYKNDRFFSFVTTTEFCLLLMIFKYLNCQFVNIWSFNF